jgi:NAD(P)-dependent dehydrogenase (short-subunit alcohol dehydrogenase family)
VLPCDVGEDAQIDAVFAELGKHWDGFDILVHSVGFAPREALDGGGRGSLPPRGVDRDLDDHDVGSAGGSLERRVGDVVVLPHDRDRGYRGQGMPDRGTHLGIRIHDDGAEN